MDGKSSEVFRQLIDLSVALVGGRGRSSRSLDPLINVIPGGIRSSKSHSTLLNTFPRLNFLHMPVNKEAFSRNTEEPVAEISIAHLLNFLPTLAAAKESDLKAVAHLGPEQAGGSVLSRADGITGKAGDQAILLGQSVHQGLRSGVHALGIETLKL